MPLQQPSYLSCVFSEVKGQAWDPRQPLSVTPVTTVHIVVTSWLTLRASVSGFSIRFALFSFKMCPRLPDKCLCIKFNSSDLILPLIRVIVSHIFHPLRGSKPLFAASTAPFPLSSRSLGVSLQSYLPDGFDPCPFSPLGPAPTCPWFSARQWLRFVLILWLPWGSLVPGRACRRVRCSGPRPSVVLRVGEAARVSPQ